MSRINLYQIVYDDHTLNRAVNDFPILDNLDNLRPDWYEYWPIRRFLLSEAVDDESYYGFFAPKFGEKTSLTLSECLRYASNVIEKGSNFDVLSFSPFFDQGAFFKNIFEQALPNHKDISKSFDQCFALLYPGLNWKNIIMPAEKTIFCNFFLATGGFWRKWLSLAELIFNNAESQFESVSALLIKEVNHGHRSAQAKVFLVERLASLIISIDENFRVINYKAMELPRARSLFSNDDDLLIRLNSLKLAFLSTGNRTYLDEFDMVRNSYLSS